MNEELLESIYNDLGLESKGVSRDKFKSGVAENSELRKSIYNDLGLESKGVKYDSFEEKLGFKTNDEEQVKKKRTKRRGRDFFIGFRNYGWEIGFSARRTN